MVNKISTTQPSLTTPVKGVPAPDAGLLGTTSADKPSAPQPATQLHLSETASATTAASQAGVIDDPIDAQLVHEIRQRIDRGAFKINFDDVASNILREALAGATSSRR